MAYPAGDLEELVLGRLRAFLLDPGAIQDAVGDYGSDAVSIEERLLAARLLARDTETLTNGELRRHILAMVKRVEVLRERVDVQIDREAIQSLGQAGTSTASVLQGSEGPLVMSMPAVPVRMGKEIRLVIAPAQGLSPARRNPALIKLVVKARAARALTEGSPGIDIETLARLQGHARDYFGVLLRVGYLAPDIVAAILEGRQPADLNRQKLARCPVPLDWGEQRQALGFSIG